MDREQEHHVLRISIICQNVEYRDNTGFVVDAMGHTGGGYVQHWQDIPCSNTRQVDRQRGRKWYISAHATESEIVQTCLMAILAFEEHEAREDFSYKGERVFGPHISVSRLGKASKFKDARS